MLAFLGESGEDEKMDTHIQKLKGKTEDQGRGQLYLMGKYGIVFYQVKRQR